LKRKWSFPARASVCEHFFVVFVVAKKKTKQKLSLSVFITFSIINFLLETRVSCRIPEQEEARKYTHTHIEIKGKGRVMHVVCVQRGNLFSCSFYLFFRLLKQTKTKRALRSGSEIHLTHSHLSFAHVEIFFVARKRHARCES
jgi:hypothetical protein